MDKVHALAYSDNKLAFSYDKGKVGILETDSGISTEVEVSLSNNIPITEIALKGDYLVACNRYEAIVTNWKTEKTLFTTQGTELSDPRCVRFPDNDTIIIAGDSAVLVYNISDDMYNDQYRELSEPVSTTFLKSKQKLICADFTGMIYFFHMSNSKPIRRFEASHTIYQIDAKEDNDTLYIWHGSYASKWNLNTGEHILNFQIEDDFEFMYGVLSDTDDILISVGESTSIYLWNTSTGQLIKTLEGHQNTIEGITISDNGVLYTGDWDGKIRRWNLENFEGEELDISDFE